MADCGACNLCCKLLAVPDIGKPARMLCWHTGLHGGCAVHREKETDPKLTACHQWKCVWLASQGLEDETKRGSRMLRPDMCHVVLGPFDRDDPHLLYVQVDPAYSAAWKNSHVQAYLSEVISKGARIEVIIDEVRFRWDGERCMPVEEASEYAQAHAEREIA
jgi:hypothetical protein